MTIKIYLCALSAYCKSCGLDKCDKQVTKYIKDIRVGLIQWLQKPNLGPSDCFGGKGGSKMKEEIQVD